MYSRVLVAAERVERVSGAVVVYAPESLRATPTVSEGLQTISFTDAYAEVTSQRQGRFSTTRPILAYAHSEESPNLVLSTERRRPQISVRQLLVTRIETGYVDYRATFFFDVLYSGVSALRAAGRFMVSVAIPFSIDSIRSVVIFFSR